MKPPMKENIFDVLMYLFENYMEDEIEMLPDSDIIKTELEEAGFEQIEVNKAFVWLESLSLQGSIKPTVTKAFRIFCTEEQAKLDLDCRNLLMYLEHIGILNARNREIVIDRAMALEHEEISLEKLKWIVLMILLSQPDEELAFSRMEDIVYDLVPTYLH
jgi:Smg protein